MRRIVGVLVVWPLRARREEEIYFMVVYDRVSVYCVRLDVPCAVCSSAQSAMLRTDLGNAPVLVYPHSCAVLALLSSIYSCAVLTLLHCINPPTLQTSTETFSSAWADTHLDRPSPPRVWTGLPALGCGAPSDGRGDPPGFRTHRIAEASQFAKAGAAPATFLHCGTIAVRHQ